MKKIVTISFVFACISLFQAEACAQFDRSVFQQNSVTRNRGFRSVQSNILSRPTTSPYLALTDLTGNGFDNSTNYFTNVRPRLERDQSQLQQQRQLQQVQRQVSEMRSAAAQRSQGGPRATGHPTRFQMYLQYYPGLR